MTSPHNSASALSGSLKPMLRLVVPGRLPSWNALLSMHHWKRAKAKKAIQEEFLSALYLSENASSIQTILAVSGCSTLCVLRESFAAMSRTKSRSKSSNVKRLKARRNIR